MQAHPRAREASFASLHAAWQKQHEEQSQNVQPQQAAHPQVHDVAASGTHAAPVPALPDGWHAVWDARYNTYYYCHPESGTTTWTAPVGAADGTGPAHEAAGSSSLTPTGFGAPVQALDVATTATAAAAEAAAPTHAAANEQPPSSGAAPLEPAAAPSHTPQTQQQPPQQQAPQSTASGWYYRDPQQRECGPFTLEQLKGWRGGLPMSLLVWYREGPDAKKHKKQQRGTKRISRAAEARLVQDLPQQPHQQLFGVAIPPKPEQLAAPEEPDSNAALEPANSSGSVASEDDTTTSSSSSDAEASLELEVDSGEQVHEVRARDEADRHSAGEEQQQQQQQPQASAGACQDAAAEGAPADTQQPPAAAVAAGPAGTGPPAATAPDLPTAPPTAAATKGAGAATKQVFFDSPATELAELLGEGALLAHWRAATAAQHQQETWLGGRPAAAAASTVAPPAPVWQQWCLQHHQQQQKQQVLAAAARLKEAGASGSSAASYAAAVLAGLPAEDEAVQLAAAAVRYGQSLDQVLQTTWATGPAKAPQSQSAAAATQQRSSSYVKDPRSGRLKLVVEEGDPTSQSFHAKELYGDLARWIDPVALEQSLTAAARAKRRAAAGGGGGAPEAGGVGAASGSGGGGRHKGANKKSRLVL